MELQELRNEINRIDDEMLALLGPVSYTHLDVYKRQGLPQVAFGHFWRVKSATPAVAVLIKPFIKLAPPLGDNRLLPVSYTHLDVYKRQGQCGGNGGFAGCQPQH